MDSEVDPVPEGWTLDPEEPASEIPDGWTLDPEPVEIPKTPKDRDMEKFTKAAGVFAVEHKTNAELKAMPMKELLAYLDKVKTEAKAVEIPQYAKGLVSGATFGWSKQIDALKPIEYEEMTNMGARGGEFQGSLVPLSKMINVVSGPAMKLAEKSPIFQKQIGSLITMMGVGSATGALETLAKHELPTASDVLEHGKDWAKLDLVLQAASVLGKTGYVAGKFTKDLLFTAKESAIPVKDLVIEVSKGVKDMIINKASPAEVQQEAFNILSKVKKNPELVAEKTKLQQAEIAQTEKAAQQAIKEKTVTPKDLKERKITNRTLESLESESPLLAEPIQPSKGDYSKEVKALEDGGMTAKLDVQSARSATKEELGTAIREDINTQRKAEKEAYKPLYEAAEEQAQYIPHHANETAETAFKTLKEIGSHKTNPEGYEGVIKTLKGIIHDAGYKIEKTAQGVQKLVKDTKRSVPVKHTMELAKRIHKKINYDQLEHKVQDNLRGVVKAAKNDVRAGLKEHPEALKAFNKAEAEHARVAQKYGTDAVKKVRSTEAGESIAKTIDNPTTLKGLQNTMSKTEYAKVEREVLENIREKDYLKAEKQLREVNEYLSKENQQLAKEIVEAKNPQNSLARRKAAQEEIYNDMSRSITDGTRPQKTLNLWGTTKGQELIRDAFKTSPNGKEVIRYLEQQSFNDMVKSVMKDGVIDFKKMKEFLKDPAMVKNILEMGGEEALNFLVKMESKLGQISNNLKLLERMPTPTEARRGQQLLERAESKAYSKGQETLRPKKTSNEKADFKENEAAKLQRGQEILKRMGEKDFPIQTMVKDVKAWIKEMLGLNAQTAMTVFGLAKVGALGSAVFGHPGPVATYLAYGYMNKLLTSQNARKNFIRLSKEKLSPIEMAMFMRSFDESLK